jgi:hypothetical protein
MKNQLFSFGFPKQEEHPNPENAFISTMGISDDRSLLFPQFLSDKKLFKSRLKRISPFLLLSIMLPGLFIYSFIGQNGNYLLQFCFLIFLEVNILFTDFALWNYFKGKRKTNIWMLELTAILVAISFII